MLISELIAKLEAVRAEHGDLECLVYNLANQEKPAGLRLVQARWRQHGQPAVDAVAFVADGYPDR